MAFAPRVDRFYARALSAVSRSTSLLLAARPLHRCSRGNCSRARIGTAAMMSQMSHRRHLEGYRGQGVRAGYPRARHATLAATAVACAGAADDQGRSQLCRLRSIDARSRACPRPGGDGRGPRPRPARVSRLLWRGHAAAARQNPGLFGSGRRDPDLPRVRPLPFRQGEAAVQRCGHSLWRRDWTAAARPLGGSAFCPRRRSDALRR